MLTTIKPILISTLIIASSASVAAIGPAFSGLVAKADDASTAFTNPAGLTRLDRNQILMAPTLAYTESKFVVDHATHSGGDSKLDQEVLAIPSFNWSTPIAPDWWFGLTINVPSGIGGDYGKNWSGRYHSRSSMLTFVAVTPVVAYKVNEQLSIGGGPTLIYTDSESIVSVNNGPNHSDGKMKLDESGVGFGWTAGVMWEFDAHQRLGFTYRSETEPDVSGVPEFSNLSPLVNDALAAKGALGKKVDVDMRTPQIAMLGYYQDINDQWGFSLDAVWVDMSRFGIKDIKIDDDIVQPENHFKDIYIGSVGVFYQYDPTWQFSAGIMHATSGKKKKYRTFSMALDEATGVGVGLQKKITEDHTFHANLNYFVLGDGDIDIEDSEVLGDIEGKFDDRFAVTIDLGYVYKF